MVERKCIEAHFVMYHKAILHKQRSPLCDWLEVLCFSEEPTLDEYHVVRIPDLSIRVLNPYKPNHQITLSFPNKCVSCVALQAELFYLYTFLDESAWEKKLADYDLIVKPVF